MKQPWAELIASGRKTIEVRTWRDSYRGPLLIVASSQPNREAAERFDMLNRPCGVAVCVVELVGIAEATASDYCNAALCSVSRGDCLWLLDEPRRVAGRVPIKGRLRLYEVADKLITLAG